MHSHSLTQWDFLSCGPTCLQSSLICPSSSRSKLSKCHKWKSNFPHPLLHQLKGQLSVVCGWFCCVCMTPSINTTRLKLMPSEQSCSQVPPPRDRRNPGSGIINIKMRWFPSVTTIRSKCPLVHRNQIRDIKPYRWNSLSTFMVPTGWTPFILHASSFLWHHLQDKFSM